MLRQHLGHCGLEREHIGGISRAAIATRLGDRLLKRATLIHRRRRNHAVVIGARADPVEFTLTYPHLSHGNLLLICLSTCSKKLKYHQNHSRR